MVAHSNENKIHEKKYIAILNRGNTQCTTKQIIIYNVQCTTKQIIIIYIIIRNRENTNLNYTCSVQHTTELTNKHLV